MFEAYAVDGQILSAFEPGLPAYAAGTDPSALGRLETRFGLWVPKASEGERLPAAALSTRRRGDAGQGYGQARGFSDSIGGGVHQSAVQR